MVWSQTRSLARLDVNDIPFIDVVADCPDFSYFRSSPNIRRACDNVALAARAGLGDPIETPLHIEGSILIDARRALADHRLRLPVCSIDAKGWRVRRSDVNTRDYKRRITVTAGIFPPGNLSVRN